MILAFSGTLAFGQQPSTGPRFEVASVKPASGTPGPAMFRAMPGGRFQISGANLQALIRFAFNVEDYQISGGPKWINSTPFDILGTPETPLTPGPDNISVFRQMLQTLLQERFQLEVRTGTKDVASFGLVVAKGGPKLKDSGDVSDARQIMMRGGPGMIEAQHMLIPVLAQNLGARLGRPVADETGLIGHYDFRVQWTPDVTEPPGGDAPVAQADGPLLASALEEQLGLKLEPRRANVQTINVLRAELPSEN